MVNRKYQLIILLLLYIYRLKGILHREPDLLEAWNLLAYLNIIIKNENNARKILNTAIKKNQNYPYFHATLSTVYQRQGQHHEAKKEIKMAIDNAKFFGDVKLFNTLLKTQIK